MTAPPTDLQPAPAFGNGTVCRNCSTPLGGPFCHACGQKDLPPDPTVREVLGDVLEEVGNVDGKLLLTLRWLFRRPGGLTAETLAGHRARYASPVRLYLICSLIFFALASISPRGGTITYKPSKEPVPADQAEKAREQGEQMVEALSASMQRNMPHAMFGLMPFFALLTWLFYRRAQPRYIPHLYYSLHFHSIAFLLFAAGILLSFLGAWLDVVAGLLPLVVFVYHYAGLRRVFGGSRMAAAWKGTLIVLLYYAAIAAVLLAITFMVLRQVRDGQPPDAYPSIESALAGGRGRGRPARPEAPPPSPAPLALRTSGAGRGQDPPIALHLPRGPSATAPTSNSSPPGASPGSR
jgi:hypothetical protein